MVRAILGVVTLVISASYYSVSLERDVYVIAMAAITAISMILFGPIGDAYRVNYVRQAAKYGSSSAQHSSAMLVFLIGCVSLGVVLLGEIMPHAIASAFVPSDRPEVVEALLPMLRIVLPLLILNQMSLNLTYMMNANGIYYLPEIWGVCAGALGIASVVVFSQHFGIYALVISGYVSSGGLFVIMAIRLKGIVSVAQTFRREHLVNALQYIGIALPFYFSYAVGQLLVIVEKRVCGGFGVGNIAIYDYAQKILSIPQSVLSSAIVTIFAPALASLYAAKDSEKYCKELSGYLRLMLLAVTPLAVFVVVIFPRLIPLVFSHKISNEGAGQLSLTLNIFMIGLCGVTLYVMFSQALLIQGRRVSYMIVSALVQCSIIAANIALADNGQVWMLATTWSIAHVVAGIVMAKMAKIKILDLAGSLGKVAALSVMLFTFIEALDRSLSWGNFEPIAAAGILCIGVLAGTVVLAWLIKLPELKSLEERIIRAKE